MYYNFISVILLYLLQFEEISYRQKNWHITYFSLTTYYDSLWASSGNNTKFIKSHVYRIS